MADNKRSIITSQQEHVLGVLWVPHQPRGQHLGVHSSTMCCSLMTGVFARRSSKPWAFTALKLLPENESVHTAYLFHGGKQRTSLLLHTHSVKPAKDHLGCVPRAKQTLVTKSALCLIGDTRNGFLHRRHIFCRQSLHFSYIWVLSIVAFTLLEVAKQNSPKEVTEKVAGKRRSSFPAQTDTKMTSCVFCQTELNV